MYRTFRLVNKEGQSYFVKFHWKPKQGLESLVWDEAQILHGKDIDFHRKDLYFFIYKSKCVYTKTFLLTEVFRNPSITHCPEYCVGNE
jgi:catalase